MDLINRSRWLCQCYCWRFRGNLTVVWQWLLLPSIVPLMPRHFRLPVMTVMKVFSFPSLCGPHVPRWLHHYPCSGCGYLCMRTSRPIQIWRRRTRLSTQAIVCDLLESTPTLTLGVSVFPPPSELCKICTEEDVQTLVGTGSFQVLLFELNILSRSFTLNKGILNREINRFPWENTKDACPNWGRSLYFIKLMPR